MSQKHDPATCNYCKLDGMFDTEATETSFRESVIAHAEDVIPINDTPDLVMLPYIDGADLVGFDRNTFPGVIKFQAGPLRNGPANGTSLEAVLQICLDRIEGYQRGRFPCDENAEAAWFIRSAIDALDLRTLHRRRQGVEGVNVAHV